tara:strand:- start:84189 stop:85385 length:1197 start_codon:yes stop_codon:yes gene_type:complete
MEENEVLVKVEGLSKKFCKDLKTSLWYGVKDLFSGITGRHNDGKLRPKEFWAVKDISFELKRGECLGLIGHNGAGKSTLLKILNGLINPDEGKITIKGRVGALIELGAGFNPILSGRENIYNNGAILGFTKKEIDDKIEEIIDFSEIREFIDMPVQNYSSGMRVRLGFAVAAQMEPDVLIIDEVLAVGDLGFVLKCFKTIDKILPKTAIVFVSHSMPMVSRICSKIILMDRGVSLIQGDEVSKAIDMYYGRFSTEKESVIFDTGEVKLNSFEISTSTYNDDLPVLNWKDDFIVNMEFTNLGLKHIPYVSVYIYDKEQRSAGMLYYQFKKEDLNADTFSLKLAHKKLQFSKGVYNITLIVYEEFENKPIYRINGVQSFQVEHPVEAWTPLLLEAEVCSN